MTELLTAAQMRAIEQEAISSGRVTGLELMERAGAGVVEAVFEEWPELGQGAHRAVVLCGPGNNGGDGFVVARLLKERSWAVEVFLYGVAEKLPPDARVNYERWSQVGATRLLSFPVAREEEINAFSHAASHLYDLDLEPKPPFLLVDALFGIGLTRPLSGLDELAVHWDYLTLFRDLNNSRVLAVDMPSGLDSDTGQVLWGDMAFPVLLADLTVTFHRCKPAHILAPDICGKVVVKDIGL